MLVLTSKHDVDFCGHIGHIHVAIAIEVATFNLDLPQNGVDEHRHVGHVHVAVAIEVAHDGLIFHGAHKGEVVDVARRGAIARIFQNAHFRAFWYHGGEQQFHICAGSHGHRLHACFVFQRGPRCGTGLAIIGRTMLVELVGLKKR